jgi:hypothetical protein
VSLKLGCPDLFKDSSKRPKPVQVVVVGERGVLATKGTRRRGTELLEFWILTNAAVAIYRKKELKINNRCCLGS